MRWLRLNGWADYILVVSAAQCFRNMLLAQQVQAAGVWLKRPVDVG